MQILTTASKDVVTFIKCFTDGAGIYAKPLTATRTEYIRRDANKTVPNEANTEESQTRRFQTLCLCECVTDWSGFTDESGKEIRFSKEALIELCELNAFIRSILFTSISTELEFIKEQEVKNSKSGEKNTQPTKQL